jgi:N-acetylmuramoyl-L-alanine amidase
LKTLPQQPRILIDPGHGGTETGSTGPDGTREKTLNLALSLQIAERLRALGYSVTLTREADTTVSLTERTEQAMPYDMLLSIHHNALPDGRDPNRAQGLSTYYYHPFSKPLANTLLSMLSPAMAVPAYGLFYDSLALTRVHQCLAVLVEVGFLTHPAEYERLTDPAFQGRFAAQFATAVQAYLRTNTA